MNNSFYALLFRQKYIARWGLMRSNIPESLSDHSFETAVIAHALALISNKRFGASYDCDHAAVLALYHDASEVYTGDLPTPVKYHSDELRDSYKRLEETAASKLLTKLPPDISAEYAKYILPQKDDYTPLVKAADKLCALIKCIEEEASGSREFASAKKSTEAALDAIEADVPAVGVFRREMLSAFTATLDEL